MSRWAGKSGGGVEKFLISFSSSIQFCVLNIYIRLIFEFLRHKMRKEWIEDGGEGWK